MECKQKFEGIRKLLTSELSLTHYESHRQIIGSDASEYGIGEVIGHTFEDCTVKAVAHASRSLTNTEKCCSQIEREVFATIFTVKKFQ